MLHRHVASVGAYTHFLFIYHIYCRQNPFFHVHGVEARGDFTCTMFLLLSKQALIAYSVLLSFLSAVIHVIIYLLHWYWIGVCISRHSLCVKIYASNDFAVDEHAHALLLILGRAKRLGAAICYVIRKPWAE